MDKLKRWTLVSASNNDTVLRENLLASPDIDAACQVIIQRGYRSASHAYNDAIRGAKEEVIVFAHQDVYFPEGWLDNLSRALDQLSAFDPNWGVLGVFGMTQSSSPEPQGYCYSTGLERVLGEAFEKPKEAQSLDEVVLVVRRSAGLAFDEALPGFHFYGTDICMEARLRGMHNYIASAFCIHNTNGIRQLPLAFWRSYFYMRRKWRRFLPITTCCATISRSYLPLCKQIAWDLRKTILRSESRGVRCGNVSELFEELVRRGRITSPGKNDHRACVPSLVCLSR